MLDDLKLVKTNVRMIYGSSGFKTKVIETQNTIKMFRFTRKSER